MGKYTVLVKPSAHKELEALPDSVLARIIRKMETLADLPRPPGCRKLHGYKNQWRVRVGDWRLLYTIDDDNFLANVTRIAHRREVYE